MGIDYGEKRIGIAVSDENQRISFPRNYILNDKKFLTGLLEIIRAENIVAVIIGYPLNLKSAKTIQTLKTEEFKNLLASELQKNKIDAELIFADERFTSKLAYDKLVNSGLSKRKRQDKGLLDSISAQILLQDYLDKIQK